MIAEKRILVVVVDLMSVRSERLYEADRSTKMQKETETRTKMLLKGLRG